MARSRLSDVLAAIKAQGRITQQNVSDIRACIFADGVITLAEADTMFEVNFLGEKPLSWNALFPEAISVFVVEQALPYGYVNSANAAWLIARISHDGVVETATELELLMRVLHKAKDVPATLERFALDQVTQAVMHGTGLIGRARQLQPGQIGEAEVELMRRVIYACSGDGGVGVSRVEAEMLFDLNDASQRGTHHQAWQDLFVGAIASHLMAITAWKTPELTEALRREKWLNAPGAVFMMPDFSGFTSALRSMLSGEKDTEGFSHANTAKAAIAEAINGDEAGWLIDRIRRDRHLTPNEIALLDFLKAQCPEIHNSVLPLIRAA